MKKLRRAAAVACAVTVDVAVGGIGVGPLVGWAAGGFAAVTLAGLWIQQ